MKRACKKFVLFIYILAVILLCPACDKDMPTVQHVAGEQQNSDVQPIEIVISHSRNVNTPEDLAARAMQSELQALLGDKAKVILYADYQMGSAREQLEALQLGRVHITIQPVSVTAQFVDDLKVLAMPYLFSENPEDVIAVLDGPLGQECLERISTESGVPAFKGLAVWFGGYKLFTFHGEDHKQLQSPADFQGIKIAVPDTSLLKAQYQHWGAEPISTEEIALYSTLAQQTAHGSEATLSQIVSSYLYEVQHNVVQAYHSAEVYTVLANAQWFVGLSSDLQQAIIEAEACGKTALYDALAKQEPTYIEMLRRVEGMRYEVLDEKQISIFKASVESIYQEQLAGSPWQIDFVQRVRQCFT